MNYYEDFDQQKQKKKTPAALILVIFLLSNALTFFLAVNYASGGLSSENEIANEYIEKMLFLRDELQKDFLWEIDEEQLWISATKGMMQGSGDVYSGYMTGEEYESYNTQNSASFEGIGIQMSVDVTGYYIEVIKVYADSPAHKSGLKTGDKIVSADGVSLEGSTTNHAASLIRGEKGTTVKLGILRGDSKEVIYYDILRDTIKNTFVTYKMLDSSIGYIFVSEFADEVGDNVKLAVEELTKKGMKGLILDLRQNPGGNVSDAVQIADMLLPKTEIMYTLNNEGYKRTTYSDESFYNIPLIVLIDENSASASEIVAGTLQDNDRAVIIGTKSFGKGIIQSLKFMKDGAMYKMTTQEYYFPSGKKIHGIGITPDTEVKQDEKYAKTLVEMIPEGKDLQLNEAISRLKKEMK